ncbi:MAG: sigma-70 family RNA polymerase sigma factor [Bacteroidota bacterium]
MTDEYIMGLVQNGDLGKSSMLFKRYKLPIYNFFLRITYDSNVSEDLTQTVFERMIRYRNSYTKSRAFRAWIYQIARNVKADHYRKNSRMYFSHIDQEKIALTEMPITEKMEQREQNKNLEQALAQLGEEQREVLLLTRFQKLKYAEVAVLMGCSEGAIKVKVHRAIKELRKIYFKIDAL